MSKRQPSKCMEFSPISLLFSFFLLLFTSSASSNTTITVSLSAFPSRKPSSDPWENINYLASSSLSRAYLLKTRNKSKASIEKTYLSPRSYGAYSISLRFGTPPQTLSFVFDTGSSLVWFPCTARYVCSSCSFPNVDTAKIPKFFPKLSSSARIVGCRNPKCAWIFGPNVMSRCQNCNPKSRNCSDACPGYGIQYGSGATIGFLLSETLDFPEKRLPDFLVGCSILSVHQPAGIAGFGRGPESLPSQMGLKRFSYCLISRRFDDSPVSSPLVLDSGSDSGDSKTSGLIYAPFRENPSGANPAFREYYYVALRKILVGGKAVKLPYKYLEPDSAGNGGAIIDSGSTFTFLDKPVFEAVAAEFEKQLIKYRRATDLEALSGLRPCFDISKEKTVEFPSLVFQFKGGAKLALPQTNYFALVSSSEVVCLTMMTDDSVGRSDGRGPAIIFGAFQQQNFYVEYDLVNQRIGFRSQKCISM